MNRLIFSTALNGARCSSQSSLNGAYRRYASSAAGGPGSAQNASASLATWLLGAGVVSAGGYYYLSRASPQTIEKAEGKVNEAVNKVVQVGSGAAQSAQGIPSTTNGALDPSKFVNFKLKAVEPYNYNTSRFIFELPEGKDSGLTVASALLMKPVVEGKGLDSKGKPAVRPYTPVSMPEEKGQMSFLIKKYPGGALTTYIHDMKPGEELAFKGPLPKHQWKANEFEHIGMVAGGTGITPMYQLLQAIDSNPEDKTKVTLLFANVTEKDILLREKFDELSKKKPDQFKIQHVIEKPDKSWKGDKGFIGRDVLVKNMPMPGLGEKIKLFVCGPPPMVEAICGNKASPKDQGPLKGHFADIGYQPSQVYKF